MNQELAPPTAPPLSVDAPPGAATVEGWRPLRLAVLGGLWAGAFIGSVATRGVPFEREQVLAWVIAAMLVVAVCAPGRRIGQVLIDWLPFLVVLAIYDYSRGAADQLGMPVHTYPQLRFDEFLFGGVLPTVWLQEHLIDPERVHTWEVIPALTYVSHFIVPFVVAGVLWVRDRPRWAAYVRRFVVLSFLGVLTFIVFPAVPPWMAGKQGLVDGEIARVAGRGWSVVNLDIAGRVLSKGQAAVNLTAAIPSLHAAYAALVGVTLWPLVGKVGRAIVVLYALTMGFTLVLFGEHYVVDILIGWAYVALTCWATSRAEHWWRNRKDPVSS